MIEKINVMIVEDSAVTRQLIKHLVERDSGINVAITARDGVEAIKDLENSEKHIDTILLDIEMPIMDGITALPKLRKISPNSDIIVVSALTRKHAEVTLDALRLGAVDYIAKDLSRESDDSVFEAFADEIINKIKTFYKRRNAEWRKIGDKDKKMSGISEEVKEKIAENTKNEAASKATRERSTQESSWTPERSYSAIAIAASTGGPRAIFDIFADLEPLNIPIFLTVHMPSSFTGVFAEQLGRISGSICVEGREGIPVQMQTIYVAPGDRHMTIKRDENKQVIISTNQNEPENFCRPAADPMLRSLAEVYRNNLLAVILTGMGKDGLDGSRKVVEAGGTVIAQDKESSAVWGMPGAVAEANLCDAIIPLKYISGSFDKCR